MDNARPDREIEKDLVFYLQSSSLIDLDQVDYSVEHGVINLKGVIDNLSHKYAVANDLEKIHGVTAVDVKNLIVKNAQKS
jgi:osmotically-inducible protein OsmY